MGKGWERRRRRLRQRLSQAGPVGGTLAAVLGLGKSRNTDCEDLFASTALAVDGVVSAEFECSDMFGGGWERGTVVLRASSRDEAARVVDALLQAFAAEPGLEPRWSTPQQYRNEDGSIVVSAGDVGFRAVPTIEQVREHYGRTEE
ncbi:hypothetical protein [Promicromonospora sp. NPDC057488]|uniref:hypothetical protein n=1 Tax=Promicromonospora sp. NPDC057488 TaxID=3346147 RepID=UPI00367108FE